jgi:hypothetical protein
VEELAHGESKKAVNGIYAWPFLPIVGWHYYGERLINYDGNGRFQKRAVLLCLN